MASCLQCVSLRIDQLLCHSNEEDLYQRPESDNVHLSSLQKILIAFNFTQFWGETFLNAELNAFSSFSQKN